VVAELMTQHPEGAGRITEAPRSFGGKKSFEEVGAESFVLAMERLLGCKEEGGGLGFR